MIENKADYVFYLRCDEIARWGRKPHFLEKIKMGNRWKFNVLLRKHEYNENCRKGILKKILNVYYVFKRKKIAHKIGWYVEPNCFGPGLCIVHIGPVIINKNVRFGANCRIQAMVIIGANQNSNEAPKAGNNIYIGPGAKIFGNINLGNNIAIGANAVVNKNFLVDNITIAKIPAKIVSNHGCEKIVKDAIKIVKKQYH